MDFDWSDFGGFDSDPGFGGADESSGLNLAVPDFSDVVGGSSSTADFSTMAASMLPSLSGIGSALAPLFGGSSPLSALGGSAAAAGMAQKGGKVAKRLIKKFLGGGRRRRMNPGNFRALHRSMRRLSAFEHAAKRVYAFTHPRPGKSHFKFRRRRRRR
jgi:hypothetical protein